MGRGEGRCIGIPTSILHAAKLNAQESRRVLYPSCIVASRYWRVLVLTGCLFKSEIGNRLRDVLGEY